MRMRVTASQILADCPMAVGFGGWGVLGSELPATGEHGPSVGYQWITLPDDADKEVWVRITTPPAAGTLLMQPDSSFDYDGPGSTFEAQLYLDGVAVGTPQPVTIAAGGVDIEIDLSNHAHTADAPALSTGTTLSISDALHGHAAAGLDLAASLGLTIQSASHAHIADSASFSAGSAIEILSANHGHAASVLDLSTSLAIVVQDALHAHVTDNIELTVPALSTFLSFPGVIDITPTSARPRITITYPA